MAFWKRSGESKVPEDIGIREIRTQEEFEQLSLLDAAVLFKHSPSCFVSMMADGRVKKFAREFPELPIYLVSVVKYRSLARSIATATGVRHESPQIIIFQYGKALAHMSHEGINAEALAGAVETLTPEPKALRG